ncbi:hypothetical protein Q5P01_010324 [Channa striata]|uniref:G-protein coupled receptors family 1 profile domain-containing protein n=1 Tax=Channa striata TaxID=64152 RepID=A0AA88N1Y8_CHASR|nr:hypothetical protein Q5P01_010324 [Channa striata]
MSFVIIMNLITFMQTSICFTYKQNIISVLSFLMFPVALLLNGVAAWVSLHLKSTSSFVVYLKNLVAADLILTLIHPIEAVSDMQGVSSVLFVLSCRYFSTIFYSTQYTSITLLGFISLDLWVTLLGGTALPNIILTNKEVANVTATSSCMTLKGPAGLELHRIIVLYLNVLFWLISVLIVVCYICIADKVIQSFRRSGSNNNQGKRKIKLRVFLVVIVFFVSFAPYHIVRIPYTFQQISYSSKSDCSYLKGKFAKEFALWIATTNTCMDPLLYVFLCREFKEKLVSMTKNALIAFKVAAAGKVQASSPKSRLNVTID